MMSKKKYSPEDVAHDRKLIEAGFHSGLAPKGAVEKVYKKYGCE